MLYRPNFCCHCGEKIARSKWLPWTSRRFCEFCQVEQMQHELLPKACAAVALLIGAAGLVSYFTGAGSADRGGAASAKVRRLSANERSESSATPGITESRTAPATPQQSSSSNTNAPTKLQREALPESSTEAVYYCGAMTRKGTPCTRRLKTKGRCWQHAGQPLAEDEMKQSRLP